MPITHIEHILVDATDLERSRRWYVDVLGMRVGLTPDFKYPVYWLYVGDRDVIHMTERRGEVSENRVRYLGNPVADSGQGSGRIDHIGFRCKGLSETMDHLRRLNVDFTERQVDDQGLYQLFLRDPDGIKIELNFAAAEAEGRRAPVVAADFTSSNR